MTILREHLLAITTIAIALFSVMPERTSASNLGIEVRLATFEADVTIPLGHSIIAGARMPAKEIVDPLSARGFLLLGGEKPFVVVAIEWCEIRNDAYDRWRDVLAEAAGTDRQHVLVTATHVHDAPVVDLTAQKLLEEHGSVGKVCDLEFHEQAVQRTAAALRASLKDARRITHFGVGQAEAGQPIDVSAVDFGSAKSLLLPAESYVEFQLFAQRLCPDQFVLVMGYGECGPGYIPTDRAVAEHDSNLDLWRWVEPPCERAMHEAVTKVLEVSEIDAIRRKDAKHGVQK